MQQTQICASVNIAATGVVAGSTTKIGSDVINRLRIAIASDGVFVGTITTEDSPDGITWYTLSTTTVTAGQATFAHPTAWGPMVRLNCTALTTAGTITVWLIGR